MPLLTNLTTARRRLAAALLAGLLAAALPHAAHAQPILRGKQQLAGPAVMRAWTPVRDIFAGPGQGALSVSWGGAAARRLTIPEVVVDARPAEPAAPIEQLIQLPAAPWLIQLP